MSEGNGEKVIIGNQPEQPNEPKPINLVISLMPNGQVNIAGPIDNRILCYGMLEIAKELVNDFRHKKPNIVQPNGSIMDFIRRKN